MVRIARIPQLSTSYWWCASPVFRSYRLVIGGAHRPHFLVRIARISWCASPAFPGAHRPHFLVRIARTSYRFPID